MMNLPPEVQLKIGEKLDNPSLSELRAAHPYFHRLYQEIYRNAIKNKAMAIHQSLSPDLQIKVPLKRLIQFGAQYPRVNLKQFMWEHYHARHPLKLSDVELNEPSLLLRSQDINNAALVLLRMIPGHTPHRLLPEYHEIVDKILHGENGHGFFSCMLWASGIVSTCYFLLDFSSSYTKNHLTYLDKMSLHYLAQLVFLCTSLCATGLIVVIFYNKDILNFLERIEKFHPMNLAEQEYATFLRAIYEEVRPLKAAHFLDAQSRKSFEWWGIAPFAVMSPTFLYGILMILYPANVLVFALLLALPNPDKSAIETVIHALMCLAAFSAPSFLLLNENYALPVMEKMLPCDKSYCPASNISLSLTTTLGLASFVATNFLYEGIRRNAVPVVEKTVNYLYQGYRSAKQWWEHAPEPPVDVEGGIHHRMN